MICAQGKIQTWVGSTHCQPALGRVSQFSLEDGGGLSAEPRPRLWSSQHDKPTLRSAFLPPKEETASALPPAEQARLGVCREGTSVGVDGEAVVSGQTALV